MTTRKSPLILPTVDTCSLCSQTVQPAQRRQCSPGYCLCPFCGGIYAESADNIWGEPIRKPVQPVREMVPIKAHHVLRIPWPPARRTLSRNR